MSILAIPSPLILIAFILGAAALFILVLEARKTSIWENCPEEFWHQAVDNLPGATLPTLEEEAIEANLRKLQRESEATNQAIEWLGMVQEAIEATTPAPAPTPAPLEVESISLRQRLFGRPEPVYFV